jgi:hypothetical protein
MHQEPAPSGPGRDGDPSSLPPGPSLGPHGWRLVPQSPGWDEDFLAARAGDEDPGDLDEYQDPGNAPPPGRDDDELAVCLH